MRAGKVLADQAQFAQTVGGHEMGVVNDRDQHLPGAMDAEGFLEEETFAAVIAPLGLDLECLTVPICCKLAGNGFGNGAGRFLGLL